MHEQVQDYYGKVLQQSDDLQTNACCTDANLPKHVKQALAKVHDEVLTRYYGCGLIAPEALQGARVLDLGSGSGRDVYVLAQLVGEQGSVVGVDMTEEQLEVARKHVDEQRERFGYAASNVEFLHGYIEKLDALGLADEQFDVIVSNCVINLSPDKEAVLREAYRLLKPGGEMYFSDVYADRRVPQALVNDPVLYGECLSGALYQPDFEHLAKQVGFHQPLSVEQREITINNRAVEEKVRPIRFYSVTYRLFKAPGIESGEEDYGLAVRYRGSEPYNPLALALDETQVFETGRITPVSGNSFRILQASRLAPHFEFFGDFSRHFGPFADGALSTHPRASAAALQSGNIDLVSAAPAKSGGGCC